MSQNEAMGFGFHLTLSSNFLFALDVMNLWLSCQHTSCLFRLDYDATSILFSWNCDLCTKISLFWWCLCYELIIRFPLFVFNFNIIASHHQNEKRISLTLEQCQRVTYERAGWLFSTLFIIHVMTNKYGGLDSMWCRMEFWVVQQRW